MVTSMDMNLKFEDANGKGPLVEDHEPTGVRVDAAYRTAEPDPRDVKIKDLESQVKVLEGSRDWHVERVKYLEDAISLARTKHDEELDAMRSEMKGGRWAQARLFLALTEIVWFVGSVALLVGTPYAIIVWKFDLNYWWFMIAGTVSLVIFYLTQAARMKRNT